MKIKQDEYNKKYYLYITDDFFIELINDWVQLRGGFNWYSMHILHIYLENDKWTGGVEFEVAVLGLGFRLRYNYNSKVLELMEVAKDVKKRSTKTNKKARK